MGLHIGWVRHIGVGTWRAAWGSAHWDGSHIGHGSGTLDGPQGRCIIFGMGRHIGWELGRGTLGNGSALGGSGPLGWSCIGVRHCGNVSHIGRSATWEMVCMVRHIWDGVSKHLGWGRDIVEWVGTLGNVSAWVGILGWVESLEDGFRHKLGWSAHWGQGHIGDVHAWVCTL